MPEAFFVSIFHLYSFDWKFDVENCLLLWHKLMKKHSKDLMKEIECLQEQRAWLSSYLHFMQLSRLLQKCCQPLLLLTLYADSALVT